MVSVFHSTPSVKADFIRKTYTHLAGAVGAFIALEWLFFQIGIAESMFLWVASAQYAWLAILGGFMVLGWIARGLASRSDDLNLQYFGLGLYVVGESFIFAPLLYVAAAYSDATVIPTAAILTLLMFAGLTTIAFTTRKDFSFLGGILKLTGFLAIGLIVCSVIFKFTLGLVFSVAMVAFASAAILYDTSRVMHHYQPHQYVAASLQLFASVALLFWYILRIVMQSRR